MEKYIEHIIDYSQKLISVKVAKIGFMAYLLLFNKIETEVRKKMIIEQVQLKNKVEKDLLKCLINLTDYFYSQSLASLKQTPSCFKVCLNIIDIAIN